MVAWTPILAGEDATRALELAGAIGERLVGRPVPAPPGLFHGEAGIAVAHAYLEEILPGRGQGDAANAVLAAAVHRLDELDSPELASGRAGVAFACYHLAGEFQAGFPAALAELVAVKPWPHRLDLMHGLGGLLVAALEAPPGEARERTLALGVDAYRGAAEAAEHRRGPVDLGVAHGLPGIAAILARVAGDGSLPESLCGEAAALADQLVERTCADRAGAPGDPGEGLAWCQGDLGVAAALAAAAAVADRPDWHGLAAELALRAAARPEPERGVVEASLCHGSAGTMLLCARLYHQLGEPALADAGRRWFQRLRADHRLGGERWAGEPGLLLGEAGIALALLAAATELEPVWDRLLAISA